MTNPAAIVGAGLAGLLAAFAWPNIPILEAAPGPAAEHKALLRFRSDAVSKLTGVEFRRVTVRQGIWSKGLFVPPSIALANGYALKVIGELLNDRSIWNLDPVERFVAPEDFYAQLIDYAGKRVAWSTPAKFSSGVDQAIISTAPLPVVMEAFGVVLDSSKFKRAPIEVARFRVPNADVFQTVYFPDEELSVYRASVTGDLLIAEFVHATEEGLRDHTDIDAISSAFGSELEDCEPLDRSSQKYGKIKPLRDALRKELLFRLTHDYGIYSLGRFATWRNILLDDVVDDISVIKRLLKSGAKYDLARGRA